MKKSDTVTEYLLIRASTCSYWDVCSFALIRIDKEWQISMQKHMYKLQALQEDRNFFALQFCANTEGFFVGAIVDELLDDAEDYAYVEVLPEELSTFEAPETALEPSHLFVTRFGTAYYSTHGKYTGEEFRTTEFSIKAVIR